MLVGGNGHRGWGRGDGDVRRGDPGCGRRVVDGTGVQVGLGGGVGGGAGCRSARTERRRRAGDRGQAGHRVGHADRCEGRVAAIGDGVAVGHDRADGREALDVGRLQQTYGGGLGGLDDQRGCCGYRRAGRWGAAGRAGVGDAAPVDVGLGGGVGGGAGFGGGRGQRRARTADAGQPGHRVGHSHGVQGDVAGIGDGVAVSDDDTGGGSRSWGCWRT